MSESEINREVDKIMKQEDGIIKEARLWRVEQLSLLGFKPGAIVRETCAGHEKIFKIHQTQSDLPIQDYAMGFQKLKNGYFGTHLHGISLNRCQLAN